MKMWHAPKPGKGCAQAWMASHFQNSHDAGHADDQCFDLYASSECVLRCDWFVYRNDVSVWCECLKLVLSATPTGLQGVVGRHGEVEVH